MFTLYIFISNLYCMYLLIRSESSYSLCVCNSGKVHFRECINKIYSLYHNRKKDV